MPSSSLSTGTGATSGEQLVGIDPGGCRPLLHGDQLDGAGDDSTQPLVGLAAPLQLLGVDHEHVDVLVADGLLPGSHVVVAVHAHRHVDGVALVGDGTRQLGGDVPGEADVFGDGAGVDHRRHGDHGDDDEQRDHDPRPEGLGSAPLAQLPEGDQPTLPQAVHAATAWRNSSDSVGG